MGRIFSISVLASFIPLSLMAAGGDSIRSRAPMTALILDARAGNEGPLLDAYFNDQIDYFLDFESATRPITQQLLFLREAGRSIAASDYVSAETRIRSLNRFPEQKIYLRAVIDAAQKRYPQALEGFRQLIDSRGDLSPHMSSLAFLGAARVFHEVDDYTQSIYHYTQVRQLEREFFEAVFEKAWSFYQSGDMNGALGVTLTFLSPYFENTFYPEAFVVRTAAFFQMCYFDRANLTVESFKREYEPIRGQIAALMQRDPGTWLFDETQLKRVHKRVTGGLVQDQRFRSAMKAYLALKDEQRRLRGGEAALAAQAMAKLRTQIIQETQRALSAMDQVMQTVLSQMEMIQIEILQAGANQLLGQVTEQNVQVKLMDLGNVEFDGLVQFWPFHGEFWVDELGSYYYGLKSNCL